jgi:cytochrome b pre-mRNA-processing protein 3
MILPLFRKNKPNRAVFAVYSAIVAQSRREIFYAQWGVADTLTGRFDMISLHLALMFRRLRNEGEDAKTFSQNVFDHFFKDMDRSLREMGVGDLSIAKRIEKMGSLFYGLLSNLSKALDSGDREELREVVSRNFFEGNTAEIDKLLDYILAAEATLAGQSAADIMGGDINFGDPA